MLLCDAIAMAVLNFLNKFIYSYLGENLTFTLRQKLFDAILYKDPSWFDRKDRAPGVLSNILSEDITLLNGLTTEYLALLVEGVLILLVGIILSFSYSWRTGLVCIALSPIILFGAFMMQRVNVKQRTGVKSKDEELEDPYAQSNALLSDMLMNYRTVISFGQKNVEMMITKYSDLLEEPRRKSIRGAHLAGFFFGFS